MFIRTVLGWVCRATGQLEYNSHGPTFLSAGSTGFFLLLLQHLTGKTKVTKDAYLLLYMQLDCITVIS